MLQASGDCYSWRLPPPRWLGGLHSVEAREKIVRCSGGGFMRGLCSPRGDRKEQLQLSVSLSYPHFRGRFLRCLTCGLGRWCQFATKPPSERSTQRERSLVATKWTSAENHRVNLVFIIFSLACILRNTSLYYFHLHCACVVALVIS
jgi:hypothetical protein